MTGKVTISEVAPRDGIQSITGDFVPTEVKIALIQALYDAGLRRMEIGSFVSPKAIPQMADTAAVLAFAKTLPGLVSIGAGAQSQGRRACDRLRCRCDADPAVGEPRAQPGQHEAHA